MLCSRVKNLLSAYSDRELTGADMLRIQDHLRNCDSCRDELAALQQIKALFGALPGAEPRRSFDPELLRTAPTAQPLWLRNLAWRAVELTDPLRELLTRPLEVPGSPLWQSLSQPLPPSVSRFAAKAALCGVGATAVLFVGMFGQPRQADAVSAQVPEMVATDESVRLPGALPMRSPMAAAHERALLLPVSYPGGMLIRSGYPERDGVQEISLEQRQPEWRMYVPAGGAIRQADYARPIAEPLGAPGSELLPPYRSGGTAPGW